MLRPQVAVVIVTRNRREELARSLDSCVAQTYGPMEIIVYDDHSTDGTAAFIRTHYPRARLIVTPERGEVLPLRNRGFRDSEADYVLSLDDDAFLASPTAIVDILRCVAPDDNIAVAALPFSEPYRATGGTMPAELHQLGRDLRSFVACAALIRRDVVQRIGGYREFLVQYGEERDLAIRLLERGYRVVAIPPGFVIHLASRSRDYRRRTYYGIRNTLLFDWLNVPQPYMLPQMAADIVKLYLYKLHWRNCITKIGYLISGLAACVKYWRERRPVSRATYRRFVSLPRHGPEPWRPEFNIHLLKRETRPADV